LTGPDRRGGHGPMGAEVINSSAGAYLSEPRRASASRVFNKYGTARGSAIPSPEWVQAISDTWDSWIFFHGSAAAIKATYSKTWDGGGFAARNAIFK